MRKLILLGLLLGMLALLAFPVYADGGQGLGRAIAAQERHTQELMTLPGVVGTAVGHGPDGKAAVLVLTERAGVAGIPNKLDGVPVATRVTGKIVALKGPPPGKGPGNGDDKQKVDPTARFPRPVPIGVSTGHPDITAGTSVYLPVFVEGALLSCGDIHAAMGDGESCFSSIESEGSMTLRCTVIDDLKLTHPMVATAKELMTVGHGKTIEEAYKIALNKMAELISEKLDVDFIDATMLISIAGDVRINQIVNNVAVGARVAIPLSLLPSGLA